MSLKAEFPEGRYFTGVRGRRIPFFAFREVLPAGGRRMHRLNVPGKEAVFRFKGISLFEFLACNARDRRAELQADGALTGKSL